MSVRKRIARLLPRIVRLRDAPAYLGMDKNRFNEEVRPHLTEKAMGKRGIAFDRLELDAWTDRYFVGNGRSEQPEELWNDPNSPMGSSGVSGQARRVRTLKTSTLKRSTATGGFVALAAQVIRKKPPAG